MGKAACTPEGGFQWAGRTCAGPACCSAT